MASPIVVMGVSGSGKSTVGAALAQRLRVPFADADDFHPPANIAKMTDRAGAQRRRPVSVAGSDRRVARRPLCRRRGDELLGAQAQVPRPTAQPLPEHEFLHLAGTPEVIGKRQASRPGHFMPASLLASQFDTLEPLQPDEGGVAVDVDQNIDSIVESYVALSDSRATEQENR